MAVAAAQLGDGEHEARCCDDAVGGPVAAGGASADLGGQPEQRSGCRGAEERRSSACDSVHLGLLRVAV